MIGENHSVPNCALSPLISIGVTMNLEGGEGELTENVRG
jgi:hypothetical protein